MLWETLSSFCFVFNSVEQVSLSVTLFQYWHHGSAFDETSVIQLYQAYPDSKFHMMVQLLNHSLHWLTKTGVCTIISWIRSSKKTIYLRHIRDRSHAGKKDTRDTAYGNVAGAGCIEILVGGLSAETLNIHFGTGQCNWAQAKINFSRADINYNYKP